MNNKWKTNKQTNDQNQISPGKFIGNILFSQAFYISFSYLISYIHMNQKEILV